MGKPARKPLTPVQLQEAERKLLLKHFGPEPFTKLAREVAVLVAGKNRAYGDAFEVSQQFIKLLWPKAVPPSAYGDMLTFVRLFDKMKRIATDATAFGEDPHQDMHGYTLLNLRRKRHAKRLLQMVGGKVQVAPEPNKFGLQAAAYPVIRTPARGKVEKLTRTKKGLKATVTIRGKKRKVAV